MKKTEEQIVNLNKKAKAEEYALGELLPKIFTMFAKDMKPKLVTFFESLDDSLFDLAEKADSNQKQTLYFESMRLIRKSRDRIFSTFFDSFKDVFQSFKKNEYDFFNSEVSDTKQQKKLSLSLIDEKELDETLAKVNLINKSEMAYHKHLFAMEKRFSLLASGTKLEHNNIPVGPHVIVNSFSQSIKVVDMEVTLKLIMYKLFERNVMGQMNSTYTLINDFFIQKGIIPEIKYNIGRASFGGAPAAHMPTQNEPQNTANNDHQNDGNTAVVNNQTTAPQPPVNNQYIDPNYQLISQLFQQNQPTFAQDVSTTDNQNPTATANSNQNPSSQAIAQGQISGQIPGQGSVGNIAMGSVMNALSILQSDMFRNMQVHEQNSMSPTEIKNELIKQLHKIDETTKDQTVKKKDEDTIDLVGMLFQFIVDDRNLPDAIQVILAKLQIPYLKIALQDKNVFANKKHPARQLLDKLSVSSVGWTEEADKNKQFINKIEDIAKTILYIDEYKEEIFVTLLEDLDKFLIRLKKKADVTQKRTKEKTLGQDKIDQAKKESAKLLVNKMTNKPMPILIRDILLGEWSSVLVLMYLRHTPKSKQYFQKVKFVEKIIEFSQKQTAFKVTKQHIEKLRSVYEEGLKLVAFNPKELIEKLNMLEKCLCQIHEIESDNTSTEDSSPPKDVELIPPEEILKLSEIRKQNNQIIDYIEEIIEPSEDDEKYEDVDDEYARMIDQLKTGTWLEFVRSGNSAVRAKLSWISPITGKYLFVNSRGLKITDKNRLALAAGLRNETIRILQQVALFDRALSAIASKLKKEEQKPDEDKENQIKST